MQNSVLLVNVEFIVKLQSNFNLELTLFYPCHNKNKNKKNKNNFASSRSDHRGPTKIKGPFSRPWLLRVRGLAEM